MNLITIAMTRGFPHLVTVAIIGSRHPRTAASAAHVQHAQGSV